MINREKIEGTVLVGTGIAGILAGVYIAEADHQGNVDELNKTVIALEHCEQGSTALEKAVDGTLSCAGVDTFYVTKEEGGDVEIDWGATKAAVIEASRSNNSPYPTGQLRRHGITAFGILFGGAIGALVGASSIGTFYRVKDFSGRAYRNLGDRLS